jgi:hypothetical protein
MNEMAQSDFEQMLRMALAPVDPPDDLKTRLEHTLQELTDAAVDELESWEIGAMRDPRNWVRPVVALVILRVRAQQKKRAAASRNPLDLAQRTLRAAAGEARKLARR